MTSYDKKKYVCKLLYMYMLGWDVDFGHVEAVKLITGTTYTEKQIVRFFFCLFFWFAASQTFA